MDCILIRLLLVACCSVTVSVGESSPRRRRVCTDSRKSVYRLFLSASEIDRQMDREREREKHINKTLNKPNQKSVRRELQPNVKRYTKAPIFTPKLCWCNHKPSPVTPQPGTCVNLTRVKSQLRHLWRNRRPARLLYVPGS